jgi:hypothetical protein
MTDNVTPSYSLILPTRGSIANLTAMIASLARDTSFHGRCEIVARMDLDDPTREMRAGVLNDPHAMIPTRILMGNRGPIGGMQAECIRHAKGEFCWLINDDMVSLTPEWDLLMDAVIAQHGRDKCYFPDDGIWGPKLGCFPLFPRKDADLTDYFGCGRFERFSVDPVINQIYGAGLGKLAYVPAWKIEHKKVDRTEWDPRNPFNGAAARDAERHADMVTSGEIAKIVGLLGGDPLTMFSKPVVLTSA